MKDVATPYIPIIKAEGGTPEAAVKDLLNTAYILRTAPPAQKVNLVRQICQQYGVDVSQLAQTQTNMDPALETLQQRLDRLEFERSQEKQFAEQQEDARIQSEIQAFSADPKNIYFDQVKAAMAPLLGSGTVKDLQEAYDQACWANPAIRAILLTAQETEKETAKKTALQSKKNAGVSVTGNPGITVPNAAPPERSLREELQANFRSYNS